MISRHAAVCLILAAGCASTIRPPADPKDPVVVVLVDYGYHSALILPAPEGWVEFAYGAWGYFALNETGFCSGLIAVCFPNQGTLGRKSRDNGADVAQLLGRVRAEELFPITVSRNLAEALRLRLEERFQRRIDTALYNSVHDLTFVKDDEDYLCWNNCNHVVLRWLEDLGCETSGCGCFADFVISNP